MSMKNIFLRRLVKILSLALVLVLILGFSQHYYMRDTGNNTVRLRGFYLEDKNTLDVVVLGASEVYQGFNACEFYKKTGVTSYPYAYASNPITFWKYELREILNRQKPKVLVVEINSAGYDDDMLYLGASVRYLTENMRLQKEKKEIVSIYGKESFLSYFFPIIKYHDQWTDKKKLKSALTLMRMDLRGHSLLKGAFMHTLQKPAKQVQKGYDQEAVQELNPNAEKYLREFLDECKDSGIEHILFVRFPHLMTTKRKVFELQRQNRAAEIIAEYGYDYVNLDAHCEKARVYKPEDFHNADHLMMDGQIKFTDYLAEFLQKRYNLQPTQLTEVQRKKWKKSMESMDACYAYYSDYMKKPNKDVEHVIYEKENVLNELRKYYK